MPEDRAHAILDDTGRNPGDLAVASDRPGVFILDCSKMPLCSQLMSTRTNLFSCYRPIESTLTCASLGDQMPLRFVRREHQGIGGGRFLGSDGQGRTGNVLNWRVGGGPWGEPLASGATS